MWRARTGPAGCASLYTVCLVLDKHHPGEAWGGGAGVGWGADTGSNFPSHPSGSIESNVDNR